jgi:hypothetical protein
VAGVAGADGAALSAALAPLPPRLYRDATPRHVESTEGLLVIGIEAPGPALAVAWGRPVDSAGAPLDPAADPAEARIQRATVAVLQDLRPDEDPAVAARLVREHLERPPQTGDAVREEVDAQLLLSARLRDALLPDPTPAGSASDGWKVVVAGPDPGKLVAALEGTPATPVHGSNVAPVIIPADALFR